MESNRLFKPRCKPLRRSGLLAVAFLAVLTTGCLRQELVSGLDERESQEIIVLLQENGLDGVREIVPQERAAPTWTVLVRGGEGNRVLAWKVLQENGLPREKVQGLGDVFAEQGMIPTSTQEKAKDSHKEKQQQSPHSHCSKGKDAHQKSYRQERVALYTQRVHPEQSLMSEE